MLTFSCANSQTFLNPSFESWKGACPVNIAPNDWMNFCSSLGLNHSGNYAGNVFPMKEIRT